MQTKNKRNQDRQKLPENDEISNKKELMNITQTP